MGIETYIGVKFGRLTPVKYLGLNSNKRKQFVCVCDCGNKKTVTDSNLRNSTRSCGCLKSELIKSTRSKTSEEKLKTANEWEQKNKRWLSDRSKELAKKRTRKYRETNRKYLNALHRHKMSTNVVYMLKWNIRNRFKQALLKNYKKGIAVSNLGCSIEQLKTHLEKQFQPGMDWNNYGLFGWHIDHIVPLSSFDLLDQYQVSKACHFTNMQPLWAKDNLSKGNK